MSAGQAGAVAPGRETSTVASPPPRPPDYLLPWRLHQPPLAMYLFAATPSRHETIVAATIRSEDPAGIPGAIDTRIESGGPVWQTVGEAVADLRERVGNSGRQRNLHTIVCRFRQRDVPVRCDLVVAVGRAIHIREITFRAALTLPVQSPVTLSAAGPDHGLPTFAAPGAPLLARQLNQALDARRVLARLLSTGYRIGSERVRVTPSFRLAPADESDHSDDDAAGSADGWSLVDAASSEQALITVVTTLAPGFGGLRLSMGVREFGKLRAAIASETG